MRAWICDIVPFSTPLPILLLLLLRIVVENDEDPGPIIEASRVRMYSNGAVAVEANRRAEPPATQGIHEGSEEAEEATGDDDDEHLVCIL